MCIAKYWSSAGDTVLEATVEFRGVVADETGKYFVELVVLLVDV